MAGILSLLLREIHVISCLAQEILKMPIVPGLGLRKEGGSQIDANGSLSRHHDQPSFFFWYEPDRFDRFRSELEWAIAPIPFQFNLDSEMFRWGVHLVIPSDKAQIKHGKIFRCADPGLPCMDKVVTMDGYGMVNRIAGYLRPARANNPELPYVRASSQSDEKII
jgi:hypothetical protein